MDTEDDRISAIAALNEPLRRRIYRFVAMQEVSVSRHYTATTLGVARSVAAFHLDKLANLGLLEVEYRHLSGRRGPGAGRPTKLYRRADNEVTLSVPQRHYDAAANLLAQAIEHAVDTSVSVIDALNVASLEYGKFMAAGIHGLEDHHSSPIEQLGNLLANYGYEPRIVRKTITLANCPFRTLTVEHRDLICGMNRALIAGVVEAVGLAGTSARLDPTPGRCCVKITV
ncbi:MAG: transcriptional regulator [Acidimicrobiaceae bacterium]|nr:transcriptional regulator [Acidimicrobiaceae bacterium]